VAIEIRLSCQRRHITVLYRIGYAGGGTPNLSGSGCPALVPPDSRHHDEGDQGW
jgi:hypothetical protein